MLQLNTFIDCKFPNNKRINREFKKHCDHTWTVAHDRQLFISICVHRDEVLGVSVQHQPPAGAGTGSIQWGFRSFIEDSVPVSFLCFSWSSQPSIIFRNWAAIFFWRWDALPASLGSYGNHSSRRVETRWLSSILSGTERGGCLEEKNHCLFFKSIFTENFVFYELMFYVQNLTLKPLKLKMCKLKYVFVLYQVVEVVKAWRISRE